MSSPSNYHVVTSPPHLQSLLSTDLNRISLLYFRADWAQPCQQMDAVVQQLADKWGKVLFLSIEAETLPEISESFEVDAVPYFILLKGHTLLTRLSGAQPTVLSSALTSFCSPTSPSSSGTALSSTTQTPRAAATLYTPAPEEDEEEEEETEKELEERCRAIMGKARVVLFMKGDRKTPRCGFSQKIIGILNAQQAGELDYETFDILSDEAVRQKLKSLNDWPTFPQLIIDGEFVGGLDVVQEMVESGELEELLSGGGA